MQTPPRDSTAAGDDAGSTAAANDTVSIGEAAGKKKPAKRGRPKGARTQTVPTQDAPASRCGKCGSTERGPYFNPRTVACQANDEHGRPYNRVTFRRTRCLACGQVRDDRTRELVREPERKNSTARKAA